MKKPTEKEILKSQIDDCLSHIRRLTSGFNEVADKNLASCYIYEKCAAEKRYIYLLRRYNDLLKNDGA